MNHHPYREWLVSEDELSAAQDQELKEHLQNCESCRELVTSWKELEVEIKRAAIIGPEPGFIVRWQAHLEQHQYLQQRRKGWMTISATAMLVLTLLILVSVQLWSLIQAPDAFLAAWFERLAAILSFIITLQSLVRSIALPGPIYTILGTALIFGIVSFMSVLWLATYRKVSMVRREA